MAKPEGAIVTYSRALRRGGMTVPEIVDLVLVNIDRESRLEAYTIVLAAEARRHALRLASEREDVSSNSPLRGIPICVKDNVDVSGSPTTCGSLGRQGEVAEADAEVSRLVRAAGSILIGKTQMYEYAYGPHVAELGVPRNPLYPEVATGGSSSGTAVAVAAGLAAGGIGTDTGGSVRVPAACCGVVGFKPTNDLVSLQGVIPLATSLDAVGPIAGTARDADVLFQGMVNPEIRHAMYGHREVRIHKAPRWKDLRIGVVDSNDLMPCDSVMIKMMQHASEVLAGSGFSVDSCRVPPLGVCQAAHRLILLSECFATHRLRLRDAKDGFQASTWQKMAAGGAILAQDYLAATKVRAQARSWFEQETSRFDLVMLPTMPCLPPLGGDEVTINGEKSRFAQEFTRYTFLANLLGVPSISMPMGVADGRPLSVQILGGAGDDRAVLAFGMTLEALQFSAGDSWLAKTT